jgi:glycosyltransferase involved in cell wall biosynthesis
LKKNYCILIPSLIPTGPVKGAIALANALADKRSVKFITLKGGAQWKMSLDQRVEIICLRNNSKNWISIYKDYCQILNDFGGRGNVVSISMCFSADFLNYFCKKYAVTFSSVRGNLPLNYKFEYGFKGILLAIVHLLILKWFDHVSVMTQAMSKQVSLFCARRSLIIGNFIDEYQIEKFRYNYLKSKTFNFIFVGSLTERKQPILLIETIKSLHLKGYNVRLDILGVGPLYSKINALITNNQLQQIVDLHGEVECPYSLLGRADAFVLPSLSEGVSRAALEALHLGVPCILRNVDGNQELITPGVNGELFNNNQQLLSIMTKMIEEPLRVRHSLLPRGFRQIEEVSKILKHLEVNL